MTTLRLAPEPGRRIAVLGAGGGMGRALVAALAAAGCRPFALDLQGALDAATLPADIPSHAVDATDEAMIAKAFGWLADTATALDGFVNLAGFASARVPITETPDLDWDDVMGGNLKSAFVSAKAALPLLKAGNAASMVLVSSRLGLVPTAGYGPYAAAKAGVLALTRQLALEHAPTVRVNALAPAAVDTPFLTGGTGRPAAPGRFDRDAYAATVPLARVASVEDVVGPIVFLLGPASAYMTGQTLHINGGLTMT